MRHIKILIAYVLAATLGSVTAATPVPTGTQQTGFLWGVNDGAVLFRECVARSNPIGSEWAKLDGALNYVSASAHGSILGIRNDGKAVIRVGVTPENLKGTGWKELKSAPATTIGALQQIASAGNHAWAVGADNSTMYRTGINEANQEGNDWLPVDGPGAIRHIALTESNTVWGINTKNQPVIREGISSGNPQGSSWKVIPSANQLQQLSANDQSVWAIATDNTIWFRKNISEENPEGTEWVKVAGVLNNISVSLDGYVWGAGADGMVYYRTGISSSDAMGSSWEKVPGTVKQLDGGHFMLPVVIPADFQAQDFEAESLAVGTRNGVLQAWSIALDGSSLYRLSKPGGSWTKVAAKDDQGQQIATPLRKVSISSDGVMCILDENGDAHLYDWDKKIFTALPKGTGNESLELERISVGKNIWAVDIDGKNIYQHTDSGWVARGAGKDVATGADGTVFSVQKDDTVSRYVGGKWQAAPGITAASIAVGSKNHVLAISKEGELYQYSGNQWQQLKSKDGKNATGIYGVTVNALGQAFITDLADNIYFREKAAVKKTPKAPAPTTQPETPTPAPTQPETPTPTPKTDEDVTPPKTDEEVTPPSDKDKDKDKDKDQDDVTDPRKPGKKKPTPTPEPEPETPEVPETPETPEDETPGAPTPGTKGPLIIVPENFVDEIGLTDDIASGSREGTLEAWCISNSGESILRFNPFSFEQDPWEALVPKDDQGRNLAQPLLDISVSSDGIMCLLDANGDAYLYDWDKKTFAKMPKGSGNESLSLEFISVGNKDNIWAVGKRNIYQYSDAGWGIVQEGEAIYVTAGVDGTVIAINEVGRVFSYIGDGNWEDVPGPRLARVSAGNADNVRGIGVDGEFYVYNGHVAGRAVATRPTTPGQPAKAEQKANKWKKRKRARRKGAKRKGQKKAAQGKKEVLKKPFLKKASLKKASSKKHGKKHHKKAGMKKPAIKTPEQTTTAPITTTIQRGDLFGDNWKQAKGRNTTALAIGFKEVAINAAGSTFLVDINGNIYHNGDAGFAITRVSQGKVEGTPAEIAPNKKTRRRARKARKLKVRRAGQTHLKNHKPGKTGKKKKSRVARKAAAAAKN